MSVNVDITVSDQVEQADDEVPDSGRLQVWASAAYLKTTVADVSLLVTTAVEIQQLNNQYRDIDRPTNVLSFPMSSPDEVDISLLGDIILCASVINEEARQQSKTAESHWAHMVIHGMLHLQGYDHVSDEEAEVMEKKEIHILEQLGFTDPYQAFMMKRNGTSDK